MVTLAWVEEGLEETEQVLKRSYIGAEELNCEIRHGTSERKIIICDRESVGA